MEDSAWELSKENIQPLKQGRQPTLLAKALRVSSVNLPAPGVENQNADNSTNSAATVRALILQQEKQEFEESLKNCMSSEDPLAIYYKYVRWIEETHPTGKEKDIRDLVNRCLKSLNEPKWMQKYANDIRWLYIWLKFALFSRNMGSLTVYNFMEKNGHCVGLAGFYLQWAEELETTGHFEEAAKVFQNGIKREAQPLPHLITGYEEFQVRYARKLQEAGSNGSDDEDATRNVLGVLKAVPPVGRTDQPTATPFMRNSTMEKVKVSKTTMEHLGGASKVPFTIFDDDKGNGEDSRASPFHESRRIGDTIACDKILCKENVQNAGVWTKANVNQAIVEESHGTSKQRGFSIFVDDAIEPAVVGKESKPSRNIRSSRPSKSICPAGSEPVLACLDKAYTGTEEYSFEELRAIRWKKDSSQRSHAASGRQVSSSISSFRPAFPPLSADQRLDSPSGNTSFTQSLYREARAAFSNTLQLGSIDRSGDVDETNTDNLPPLSLVSREPAVAGGFVIYEDSVAGGNANPVAQDDADKENVDPKKRPGVDGGEKKRRNVAGVLCASTEFPCFDENNKDDFIVIEEADNPAIPEPIGANAAGNSTTFDFNETTVAGLHRFLPPNGTRAFSTPCHNASRIQPLSLSMYKPGEALDFGNIERDLNGIGLNEDEEDAEADRRYSADVVHKVTGGGGKNVITQKLSAIAETSREYRSSSASSNSATTSTSGNNRGRLHSGASGIAAMPSIFEAAVEVRSTLAFSTPFSDVGDELYSQGRLRVKGTPSYERGTPSWSGAQTSGAVRKLLLDDDTENREGAIVGNMSVNPWEMAFVEFQLATMPRLETYPNYHTFDERIPSVDIGDTVCLGGENYLIKGLVGEGAFAKVFKCQLEQENESSFVLKVQKPRCPIEFSICQELHRRLKAQHSLPAVQRGLTEFKEGYVFKDGSILVSEYSPFGTLIDLVNVYKQISSEKSPPEIIVAYLTAEILRIVEAVHSQRIIHGDVKPDNFLVLDAPPLDSLDLMSKVSSVRLIDWGRSIDATHLPPSTTFHGRSHTSGFICCEMQDGRPWTYQTDYFGILGTVHVLAFGSYMSVYKVASTNRWRVNSTFKRRWDDSLWRDFFDTFLNVPDCSSLPSLADWRMRFENFVNVQRSNRSSSWISEVKKMRDVLVELKTMQAKKKRLT